MTSRITLPTALADSEPARAHAIATLQCYFGLGAHTTHVGQDGRHFSFSGARFDTWDSTGDTNIPTANAASLIERLIELLIDRPDGWDPDCCPGKSIPRNLRPEPSRCSGLQSRISRNPL